MYVNITLTKDDARIIQPTIKIFTIDIHFFAVQFRTLFLYVFSLYANKCSVAYDTHQILNKNIIIFFIFIVYASPHQMMVTSYWITQRTGQMLLPCHYCWRQPRIVEQNRLEMLCFLVNRFNLLSDTTQNKHQS